MIGSAPGLLRGRGTAVSDPTSALIRLLVPQRTASERGECKLAGQNDARFATRSGSIGQCLTVKRVCMLIFGATE
jgi:hypothetical protein